jgi:hypothetical protein
MYETPNREGEGHLSARTHREAIELLADDHPLRARADSVVGAQRLRTDLAPEHQVAWVRVSDLINSGAGRMAGRGIDLEAELARRLRHPVEVTRRAVANRSSSLPPLDAFGRSRSRISRDTLGRS